MRTENRWKYRRIFVPGSGGRRSRSTEQSGPDMTSLMDIVFIMLIFFIVTASFVHEKGLETNIQKPDVSRIDTVEKDQPLIFEIESANHVFVGNRLVDVASVGPLVKRELASMPDLKVVVRPAQASHTGIMIGVIDEAIQAGLPEEALIVVRKPY